MKRVLSILAVIPLLAACSGAPVSTPTPTAQEPTAVVARGVIDVDATLFKADEGASCTTSGGYKDIGIGTQVKILDADGKVLAFGELGGGKVTKLKRCAFPFTVFDVPKGHGIYGVEVAKRGVIQVKEADLGAVSLKLG